MVQKRSLVLPLLIYFYFFVCNAFKTGSKQEKYEVILNDAYSCPEAHPPYKKNRRVIPNYTVNDQNGKRYLTGYTTITSPTPFTNFSIRTFFVNNSKSEMKMQIPSVSCKNVLARAALVFANMSVTQKNCMLKPGKYHYNLDLNKVSHAVPNWHGPGLVVHQVQLVSDGATELCDEVSVTIKRG